MFIVANAVVPFASGYVIPLLMDWHAAPHRESAWLKAVMAVTFGAVFVTLLHTLTDSSDSLRVVLPLGVASAFLGLLCLAAVRRIRSRLAGLFSSPGQTAARSGPRERRPMPPHISRARAYAPISFRKRQRGGPRKD